MKARSFYFYTKILILLLIIIGYVTPTNTYAARLSVLFSAGGATEITFSGYTTTYDGNLGGIKGANQKCAAAYAGSRVCLFDDFIKLGANYPYTYDVWWFDGVAAVDTNVYSRFGNGTNTGGMGSCYSWTNAGASAYGFIFSTSGSGGSNTCVATYRLACCK